MVNYNLHTILIRKVKQKYIWDICQQHNLKWSQDQGRIWNVSNE